MFLRAHGDGTKRMCEWASACFFHDRASAWWPWQQESVWLRRADDDEGSLCDAGCDDRD
ncbi:hypothetical protein GYH30_003877 [Glycine max]|nr:hypothetical protein GYH30_003877 [Glycine max]